MTEAARAVHDIVILGGGPAASAAARLLSGWGHSVLVLARGATRDAMAESLPPSASRLLDRVGMTAAVNDAGFVRSTGNSVRWGGFDTRPEPFGDGALGWQVRRDRLDDVLLQCARSAGAIVQTDVSVRGVSDADDDGVRDVAYEGERRASVRARWVLDCTGRAGVVARRGWRSGESTSRTLAVVGVWEREAPWGLHDETHTVVESYDAGWAWSIPVSARQRYVTVMVDPAHTAIGSGAELLATYREGLRRTTAMRELVNSASLVGAPWARESSPYAFSRAADDGVMLAGDAASFVDPLSSFGMKKALASAWLAAVVVHAALRDRAVTAPALDLYEEREREMHVELQRQAAALARDAAALHQTDFWSDRSADAGLRSAPIASAEATRAAFDDIRSRPAITLRRAPSLTLAPRAVVRGNDIEVVPHLVNAQSPRGVRFAHNVDVVHLTELAAGFTQVPDLYEAYSRRTKSQVDLSHFLAALSTLVAIGALELLDSPRPMS